MRMRAALLSLLLPLSLAAVYLASAAAAGETYATYGADTTPAERDAIARLAGLTAPASTDTVATAEIVDAVQGSGLPASPTDYSIASAIVTCLNPGEGLTVSTQNITRLTAPVYAGALLAAGVQDGRVVIAAPPDRPVPGETALVGVLRGFPQCQGGRPLDPARVDLAYKQIAWILALTSPNGNLEQSSNVLLKAEAPIVAGQATDSAAVSNVLDAAAASESVTVDPSMRSALVDFLRAFEHLDYGAYGKGFSIQKTSPTEARLIAATAPPGPAAGFTGVVEHAGRPLTVRVSSQDRLLVVPAANAVVTRDGRSSSLGALRKGDRVTVATSPDGTAQRIDASTAATGFGGWQWVVVVLLVLAGLLLVAAMAGLGREDGFILEPKPGRGLPPA